MQGMRGLSTLPASLDLFLSASQPLCPFHFPALAPLLSLTTLFPFSLFSFQQPLPERGPPHSPTAARFPIASFLFVPILTPASWAVRKIKTINKMHFVYVRETEREGRKRRGEHFSGDPGIFGALRCQAWLRKKMKLPREGKILWRLIAHLHIPKAQCMTL